LIGTPILGGLDHEYRLAGECGVTRLKCSR
jgi:hypothetical protein